MRINTELNNEDREKTIQYSKDKGLRLRKAYAVLIKKALEEEGY